MTKYLLITLFLSTSPVLARTPDSCSFNFEKFKSPLDSKSKSMKKFSDQRKDLSKKVVTQSAELKSGEKVEYQGGGCAHFAFSLTYSGARFNYANVNKFLIKSIDLVEQTELTDKSQLILVEALKKKKSEKLSEEKSGLYQLNCGDAQCSLDLSQKSVIRLNYDFAL